jgi:hypothetical protein
VTSKEAFAISAAVLLCVVAGVVTVLSGGLNPLRDVRRGEEEFRGLLDSLTAETSHDDVRHITHRLRELNFSDFPSRSSVYLKPHLLRYMDGGADMFAWIRYSPEGRVVYVQAGYATTSADPIPGIPRHRCFVTMPECESDDGLAGRDPR